MSEQHELDEKSGPSLVAGVATIAGFIVVGTAGAMAVMQNMATSDVPAQATEEVVVPLDPFAPKPIIVEPEAETVIAATEEPEPEPIHEFLALPHAFGDWRRTDYIGTDAIQQAFASIGIDPTGGALHSTPQISRSAAIFRRDSERFLLLIENGDGLPARGASAAVRIQLAGIDFEQVAGNGDALHLVADPAEGIRISIYGQARQETAGVFVERMNLAALRLN